MKRATDMCTCNHTRDDHGLVVRVGSTKWENACTECQCLNFFPHPQPFTAKSEEKPTFEDAILSFMRLHGTTYFTDETDPAYHVILPNGENWRITIDKIS